MNIFLEVIGCRLNQSEVEGFSNIFRALGHRIVADPAEADLAIVNTCAVTVKAAADSRKQLRRSAREGASKVIATGCWATLYPEKALDLPGVTDVFTNQEKDILIPEILELPPEKISQLNLVRDPLPGDRSRTRAFIKVQEGCNNNCTYCLTKLARGKSRSRSMDEIQRDITAVIAGGAKEIVLTGVQLGAWGRDFSQPLGFKVLLSNILGKDGYHRLRLSSIEPWDLDPALLFFWKDERLCRHLHLPLQSGHDRILKEMRRPFSVSAYHDLVNTIRAEIPDIAITTDVITGFPGESESEFVATKTLIQKLGFAGGHVFTYSPRPGTAAFNMKDRVPVKTAKARNAELRKLFQVAGLAYRKQFIGRKMAVLWESSDQSEDGAWRLSGLTDNYMRVYVDSATNLRNCLSVVKMERHYPQRNALFGRITKSL